MFGDRSVSYAEFGARVNVLARELISQGVGPETAVGVVIDRSVEMFVAIHAVIAAGGQYVPIDTDTPADRMRSMTQTAGVGLILVADDTAPVAVPDGMPTCVVDCSGTADLTAPPVADTERRAPLRPSPPSTRCSPPGRPARRRA